MENQKNFLSRIENLTEAQKLELFNVEELETRLEMAAVTALTGTNSGCQAKPTDTNSGCTSNSSCGW